MSDCRSRGCEFDSGFWPSPILSWSLIMKSFLRPFSFLLLIQDGLLSVTHKILVKLLVKLAEEKSVFRCTDHPDMIIAFDWDVKKQTKPKQHMFLLRNKKKYF